MSDQAHFCLVCHKKFEGGWVSKNLPHYIVFLCSEQCCLILQAQTGIVVEKKEKETKHIPRLDKQCGRCKKIVDYKAEHCPACFPEAQTDNVNKPEHYRNHPSGVECITVTEHMNFCLGNAMKYLWRADHKGGLEDLKKAAWYIQREIERRER